MNRVVITNVRIADGSGAPLYEGEVLVENEHIAAVAVGRLPESKRKEDTVVIDGGGKILAPGFIDAHSHSDLAILLDPVLGPKIRQGITTEILGQDGISMAPLPKEYISDWRKNIGGLDGDSDDFDWNYETVKGYIDRIDRAKTTSNAAYLVPHGNVRLAAMGFSDSDPTSDELTKMCEITEEAMKDGCVGLSSGLIYIPCVYGKTEELIELCKVVARYDGLFVVHQRSEANQILESMDEIIRIGRESGVRIHFSHFKICGKNNADKFESVLARLENARKEGITVSFDFYPYVAGSTMLSAIVPPWAHVGGTDEMLKRLEESQTRERIKKEMAESDSSWDNFVEFASTAGIYITSVVSEKNKYLVGKSLDEIGVIQHKDPLDAACDLLVEEENQVGMIDFYGLEEHLDAFVQRPEMSVCTDGLLGGKVHPRAYGAFPRIISEYVKKKKLLSIEEAVYRMSGFPASLLKIERRGEVKEGNFADLVIFDPETFGDRGTYTDPKQFPDGLSLVMVNGSVVFDGKAFHTTDCGKFLRREGQ